MTGKDLAKLFIEEIKSGQEVDPAHYIAFIKHHDLESFVPSMMKVINWELKKIKEEDECIIESPYELSENSTKKVLKLVGAIESEFVKREDLIGGFKAKYKGVVYDMSVQNNLKKLKKHLTK